MQNTLNRLRKTYRLSENSLANNVVVFSTTFDCFMKLKETDGKPVFMDHSHWRLMAKPSMNGFLFWVIGSAVEWRIHSRHSLKGLSRYLQEEWAIFTRWRHAHFATELVQWFICLDRELIVPRRGGSGRNLTHDKVCGWRARLKFKERLKWELTVKFWTKLALWSAPGKYKTLVNRQNTNSSSYF